jgi:uncharacterized membrane protein
MTPDLPANPILDEYLAELERAAADLPVARRAELLADIHAHIAEACGETSGDPANALPAILARLGDPAEIAAAARSDLPPTEPPTGAEQTSRGGPGTREALAIVLLLVSGLAFWLVPLLDLHLAGLRVRLPLALVGWLAGLGLLCTSRHWTLRDKLIGLCGAGFAPMLLSTLVFGVTASTVCSSSAAAPAPVIITGTTVHRAIVTAAPVTSSAMDCTTDQMMPRAIVVALLLSLLAGIALSLRQLSRTKSRPLLTP